jgi:hypothetical protein
VPSGAQLDALLDELDEGTERSLGAAERLLAMDLDALAAALWSRFPGELHEQRLRKRLPRASQCSAVLKALAVLGRPVLRTIDGALAHPEPLHRFYATYLITELTYPEAAPLVLQMTEDEDPAVRRVAYHTMRKFRELPVFAEILGELHGHLASHDARRRKRAIEAVGVMAEAQSVPRLIPLLGDQEKVVRMAAHDALVNLTKRDFKWHQEDWRAWWEANAHRDRVEWLMDGLVHRDAAVRTTSAAELEALRGEPIGFSVDMSRKDRVELRRSCREWWAFQQWWEENQMTSGTLPADRRLLPSPLRRYNASS